MKHKFIIICTILVLILAMLGITYIYVKNAELNIPKHISKEYNLSKEDFNGKTVYVISPKENGNNKVILYQHGGSYTTNLTNMYWEFLGDIVNDTKATVIVPDYPLTPTYDYTDVFEMMIPLYTEVINKVGKENLIVMGDSAGGGLSLAMCQYAGEQGIKQPSQLILISPWLDVSMSNPKIDEVQKVDPLLNKELLKVAGQVYVKDTSIDNYLVSPINGPLDRLEDVTIFSGTYDILNPDTEKFVQKAKNNGLDINYICTDQAVHIWILSHKNDNIYNAKEDYNKLINLINKGEK